MEELASAPPHVSMVLAWAAHLYGTEHGASQGCEYQAWSGNAEATIGVEVFGRWRVAFTN